MEGTSRMHPDNSEQILVASRFHGNKRGLKGNSWNLHRYYASILYPKDFFPSHPSFKPFPQNKIHQSFTLRLSFNHRRVPSASSCGLVYFYDYLATIIVCNPATEQSRTLPSLWALEQVMLGSGFGYDPTSDDYKIVRVYTSDDSYIDDIRAQVHALKSDCWKEIKMMPDLPRFDIDNVGGVYVSGSCYWIVALQFRNPYSILSFDFATETFSTLHLPQPLPPRHGYRLVELDGRLGAILYKRFDRMDVRRHTNVFEVWVLEEGSSWVIHSRVPIDNASVPLALRHDVLFFEGKCDFDNRVNQLFVYDLVAEKVEALDVFDRPGSMMVIPYVETTYAIPDYEQMTKYTEHERKRDHDHDEHVECILVDENDHVVDPETKYICHMMEKIEALNLLHRAFSVFLFNSKYELLLQQRSKTKVTFPLVWTNTCCLPLSRDSELIEENALGVRNAAQRKLLDELGIPAEDVPVDQFIPLGRMLYKAPSDGKLDYLLFIVRDVRVHPNPDQVHDVKYVNREELKELLRKADAGDGGSELSPWFRLVVDHFLFKWWDHVEKGTIKEAADMKTIRNLT